MSTLFLAELVVYDPTSASTRTLRYATGQGHITGPTETPASSYYDARLTQAVNIKRDLFSTGTTIGRSRTGYGDLVLLNGDGALDGLMQYGFDGRAITIRRGEPGARYPSGFTTVFVGTMEQAEVTSAYVTIKLRDRQYELQQPLQVTKYAGSNVLPAGLEGIATDIKGKPKPICYGVVTNVSPPVVNTTKLIYQVADATVTAIDAVYDRGVALTVGAAYASEADLLDDTLAPAAGAYKFYLAGGYFRLGSTPAGQVTADVTQGTNAAARTAAQTFTQVLTRAGKSSADWSADDVTALDVANAAVIGFWQGTDETTLNEVLDQIAQSVGAWWGVDRAGVFRIKRFVAPTGTSAASFTANDLLAAPERIATQDLGHGLPTYRTIVRYAKNYTVQSTDLAAAVTGPRRAEISQEWRESVVTDATVQTQNLLAPALIVETLLRSASDAATEATRIQALRGVQRERFEIVIQESAAALDSSSGAIRVTETDEERLTEDGLTRLFESYESVDLGDVITLTHTRYLLGAGEKFVVLGVEPDAKNARLTLTLWGASGIRRVTEDDTDRTTEDGLARYLEAA